MSPPIVERLRSLRGDYRLHCTQEAADTIEELVEALREADHVFNNVLRLNSVGFSLSGETTERIRRLRKKIALLTKLNGAS
jgi:precorrin-4 methylase